MKYHGLFVILKKRQNLQLSSVRIIGGALRFTAYAISTIISLGGP